MTDKSIYFAHPVTGEYIGTGYADPDPLTPDHWLIPAHAYPDAPPTTAAGEAAVWASSAWIVLPDHRGTVYRTDTGATVSHDQLGDLPEGLTTAPRPSPDHTWFNGQWHFDQALADGLRADAEALAWETIKAERDRRTQHGGFQVGEYWFHSDTFSRSQQLGLVIMGASIPVGLQWKTMSGAFVNMSAELAQGIFAAGAASDQAIFAAAEQHRAAMLASVDPATYDYSTGWPLGYGE